MNFHLSLGAVCCFIFTLVSATSVRSQTPNSEFVIGVVPNVSARIIATNYQPLAQYFENGLGRPVQITTAKNFATFHQQALAKDFQLMVTAPNLGRVAVKDAGWEVLYVFEPSIPGLLVGLANQNNDLSKLKGKKLALANPQSLVALAGMNWLKEQGYLQGKDYEILQIANDDSLGIALTSDEAPFAMMSMGEFKAKDPQLQSSLKILNEFVKLPGFFIMASPTLNSADKQKIQSLLKQLPSTELGSTFFKRAGFTGMVLPTDAQNKFLDNFVDATRAALIPKN